MDWGPKPARILHQPRDFATKKRPWPLKYRFPLLNHKKLVKQLCRQFCSWITLPAGSGSIPVECSCLLSARLTPVMHQVFTWATSGNYPDSKRVNFRILNAGFSELYLFVEQ